MLGSGDEMADALEAAGVARLVPIGDCEAAATALRELLDPDTAGRARLAAETLAAQHDWDAVAHELVAAASAVRETGLLRHRRALPAATAATSYYALAFRDRARARAGRVV